MTVEDILDKIEYEYDIDKVDMLSFNYYTKLSTREYNCLINDYKKNKTKRVHDFLYANSYMIYRAIYNRRYCKLSYGLKTLNGWYEDDMLQDFIFCFYHTLNKYQDIGEASSYCSYIDYHYRYYMTELLRNKYFQVMKVPQKESRKQETRAYKSELFENSSIFHFAEQEIIERADRNLHSLMKQVKIMIDKKQFTKLDWEMFLKYNGLTEDSIPRTLEYLKEEYKLSSCNKVYYRISKVVTACQKNYLFNKRNEARQ